MGAGELRLAASTWPAISRASGPVKRPRRRRRRHVRARTAACTRQWCVPISSFQRRVGTVVSRDSRPSWLHRQRPGGVIVERHGGRRSAASGRLPPGVTSAEKWPASIARAARRAGRPPPNGRSPPAAGWPDTVRPSWLLRRRPGSARQGRGRRARGLRPRGHVGPTAAGCSCRQARRCPSSAGMQRRIRPGCGRRR